MSGVIDADGEDYPLIYYFGYKLGSLTVEKLA